MYKRSGVAKVKVGMFGFLSIVAVAGALYGITAMIFGSPADEDPADDALIVEIGPDDGEEEEAATPAEPEAAVEPEAGEPPKKSDWNPEWGDDPNSIYEG